ncbi:hypothetical protein ILT44_22610 [Microvirga sp. BT689]|uniref:hypothetical protein n=1 Tax=Microvirga arvi TaxID=2778731 RepID=UPI0019520E83|nr:hypothetical protein [Microvirga arvi]MBM6583000.1 hypothetical protein [Microvirga arvi]
MSIYWMKTADVYPDSSWSENSFTAFDPEVRFPRFHMETGDEPIGGVDLIKGGLQDGLWRWSMTVSLSGPRYGRPINGVELTRGAAGRRVVEVYQHYLSTRPEQYPRVPAKTDEV